jgi:serine/tyrosine/threonine adenylyltransferase
MSPLTPIALRHDYADALPELTVDWSAEEQPDPQLLVLNEPLARELGLDADWLRSAEGVQFLIGRTLPEKARPVAMGYAGHQFGQLSPRLGDGRALLLGEIAAADGSLRDLHLKGSGQTPFSRGGDGRGAVGPMLREYLMSEAMAALGVPTTRSLAVVATGRSIPRAGGPEPGALLVRVAQGHSRVGTVQYTRLLDGEGGLTGRLADYAIGRHYPKLAEAEHPYRELFTAVAHAQSATVAQWLRLGFVHGVMNTDNTTLTGETIDYGPCAFTDRYDPDAVFSSIDHGARYAFGRQPTILGWNLARLAESMLPLFDDDPNVALEWAQEAINAFPGIYTSARHASIGEALDVAADSPLVEAYLSLVQATAPDLTSFHRGLVAAAEGDARMALSSVAPGHQGAVESFLESWRATSPDATTLARLHPIYIPRNHLVDDALRHAERGDLAAYERLLAAVTNPFDPSSQLLELVGPAPETFGPFITYCGT